MVTVILIDNEDIEKHDNNKIVYQINTLNSEEVLELRRQKLDANHFKINNFFTDYIKKMLKLLMTNYKVFSTSFKTLGSADKVVLQFKLSHNFSLQIKLYPILKIAKDFARKEILKLPNSCITHQIIISL